jgi:hypothetical protein
VNILSGRPIGLEDIKDISRVMDVSGGGVLEMDAQEKEEHARKEGEERVMILLEYARKECASRKEEVEHARKERVRKEEEESARKKEEEHARKKEKNDKRARKVKEDEHARKEQHEQDVKSCEEITRKRLREMEEVRSKRLLEIGMDE